MMRIKDKDKLMGRFKKPYTSKSSKKPLILEVQTPNHNHIKRAPVKNFRSSKKNIKIDNNSSVISINTLIQTSTNDINSLKSQALDKSLSKKPTFLKKKSGSILKRKKSKYEPSKLLDYYSRSSFQKI